MVVTLLLLLLLLLLLVVMMSVFLLSDCKVWRREEDVGVRIGGRSEHGGGQ